MAIARYKYAAQTVQETMDMSLSPDAAWGFEKSLEGSIGVVFQVRCAYTGGSRGLTVRVAQGINPLLPADSPETAVIAFEMPNPGVDTSVTIPVMLPQIGPKVALQVENTSGEFASVTIWSRLIEGIEIA